MKRLDGRGRIKDDRTITFTWDGREMSAHPGDTIASALLANGVRVLGSSVLEACLVADGAIDAFCDAGGDIHRIVDLAAVDLIVKAAGGVLIDLHGRALTFEPDLSLRWSGIVAATPQLAEELRSEILRSN